MKVKWFSFLFQLNLNYCILCARTCVCVCVCVLCVGSVRLHLAFRKLSQGLNNKYSFNLVMFLLKNSNSHRMESKSVIQHSGHSGELVTASIFPTSSSFFHLSLTAHGFLKIWERISPGIKPLPKAFFFQNCLSLRS